MVELPWDSVWTWIACMVGVDFCYYWVHRCGHGNAEITMATNCGPALTHIYVMFAEVNFMWAAHQVHHSSEDYNLSTALRQSALQAYSSWVTKYSI